MNLNLPPTPELQHMQMNITTSLRGTNIPVLSVPQIGKDKTVKQHIIYLQSISASSAVSVDPEDTTRINIQDGNNPGKNMASIVNVLCLINP